ncbi:MAG: DUF1080 domain-containing protein [Planctomycetaceae bacterium]
MRACFLTRPWLAVLSVCLTASAFAFVEEYKSGIDWPEPRVVTPGESGGAPSDAIVLFDGHDLSAWEGVENWTISDGVATVGSTITSKQKFGDCQLHLEFASPAEVQGEGQGRGNSGIYFMSRYELQILDSFDNSTYFDGQCASIYKQHPPLVNACRAPGEWQTYDIIFTAPRFAADGSLESPAAMTVLQNNVLVQNHFELQGGTFYEQRAAYSAHGDRDAFILQHHGNPVQFRNIWVRDLQRQPE